MTWRRPPRPSLVALVAALMAPGVAATAREAQDDPVGWPWRPAEKPPAPRPPAADMPQPRPPAAEAPLETAAEKPANRPSRRVLAPESYLGALDRIVLPIEPLTFTFAGARTALIRRETLALDRLAVRLRRHPEPVRVTARATDRARGRAAALRLALMRGLAVRHYLVEEGVAETLIEVVALTDAAGDSVDVGAVGAAARSSAR